MKVSFNPDSTLKGNAECYEAENVSRQGRGHISHISDAHKKSAEN